MLISEHRGVYCSDLLLSGSLGCNSSWGFKFDEWACGRSHFQQHTDSSSSWQEGACLSCSSCTSWCCTSSICLCLCRERENGEEKETLQQTAVSRTGSLCCSAQGVKLFPVLSGGTGVLVCPTDWHKLVLPAASAGNKPSRNMDPISLVLVLCNCGWLGFFPAYRPERTSACYLRHAI